MPIKDLYPEARTAGIVIQIVGGEILIYDLETDKAFCLNETSSIIWNLCDGKSSIDNIAAQTSKKVKNKVDADYCWLAIHQLEKSGLLADNVAISDRLSSLSRRKLIRRVGFASAVALPIISSIVAPKATSAQSVQAICEPCGYGGDPSCPPGKFCLVCVDGEPGATPCLSTFHCVVPVTYNYSTPGSVVACQYNALYCSAVVSDFCCSATGFLGPQGFCPPGQYECTCS